MGSLRWTKDIAEDLIEYYDSHSAKETAEKYNVESETLRKLVSYLSKKYNIDRYIPTKQKWTKQTAEEFVEYYDTHTVEETAEKYNIAASSVSSRVWYVVKRYGVDRHIRTQHKWNKETAEEFVEYYDTHTVEETAEKYNIATSSVTSTLWSLVNRYGVDRFINEQHKTLPIDMCESVSVETDSIQQIAQRIVDLFVDDDVNVVTDLDALTSVNDLIAGGQTLTMLVDIIKSIRHDRLKRDIEYTQSCILKAQGMIDGVISDKPSDSEICQTRNKLDDGVYTRRVTGRVNWTKEKAEELVQYYDTHSAKETAEKYNIGRVDVSSIVSRLSKRYHIERPNKRKSWTRESAKEFIEYYNSHSVDDTIKRYNMDRRSTIGTANRLSKRYHIDVVSLRKDHHWTKEEIEEMVEYYKDHTAKETADRFNIDNISTFYTVICKMSKRYNIKR